MNVITVAWDVAAIVSRPSCSGQACSWEAAALIMTCFSSLYEAAAVFISGVLYLKIRSAECAVVADPTPRVPLRLHQAPLIRIEAQPVDLKVIYLPSGIAMLGQRCPSLIAPSSIAVPLVRAPPPAGLTERLRVQHSLVHTGAVLTDCEPTQLRGQAWLDIQQPPQPQTDASTEIAAEYVQTYVQPMSDSDFANISSEQELQLQRADGTPASSSRVLDPPHLTKTPSLSSCSPLVPSTATYNVTYTPNMVRTAEGDYVYVVPVTAVTQY
eukprot:TRINITY_DN8088_c0_g1_i3.p1 TRINITY_DN8088_c0_g1~~TRINITY_DN8088_c0_g1_i3.p1  ORF type:complete len:269 (+),score=28.23 TRINITY_DN8088_c0_g1_i3:344-1150(+)